MNFQAKMDHKVSQRQAGPDGRKGLKVMIVDDDPMILRLVDAMLKRIGITADMAGGGFEALRLLDKIEYDLVVTDLKMPHLNGFDLADAIKKKCDKTVVIIMTGLSPAETEHLRQQPGPVDGWIFKPFHFDQFKKLIIPRVNGGVGSDSCK